MGRKVIVTCALVGSATRTNQNPNTPYTPKEMVEAAHRLTRPGRPGFIVEEEYKHTQKSFNRYLR